MAGTKPVKDDPGARAVELGVITQNEKFLSDVSVLWTQTKDTLDSFAKTYLSAEAEDKKLSGPEWLEKNFELAARMWFIGLKATDVAIKRTVDMATEQISTSKATRPRRRLRFWPPGFVRVSGTESKSGE